MAIPSQYPGTCKDCGSKYEKGDMIDMNGNESPNTKGEIKPHWCKDGKNCQGAQKFSGSQVFDKPQQSTDKRITYLEPPVEELRKNFDALNEDLKKVEPYPTIADYIDTRECCEKLGIRLPITIGMIWNNRVRGRN